MITPLRGEKCDPDEVLELVTERAIESWLEDIERHGTWRRGSDWYPAINIKIYEWPEQPECMSDEQYWDWWHWTMEDQWNWFKEDIGEKWGKWVSEKICCDGKSGGWLVWESKPDTLEELKEFREIYDWMANYVKRFKESVKEWLEEVLKEHIECNPEIYEKEEEDD